MNPKQYIRKQLESEMSRNPCRARTLQRKLIDDTLQKYIRGEYHDIDELLADVQQRIKELSFIGRGTTVERFALAMSVSRTTARLHLLKLDHIKRNESKRPYIYTVGKS